MCVCVCESVCVCVWCVCEITDSGHLYPVLQDPGSLDRFERPVTEAGGNDAVGDAVELADRGSDGRRQMFLPFLISLRPDASQTVIRHDPLEQLLHDTNTGPSASGDRMRRTQLLYIHNTPEDQLCEAQARLCVWLHDQSQSRLDRSCDSHVHQ